MKTFRQIALAIFSLCVLSSTGLCQGMNVALLDLGYVFENYPAFNSKMEAMKAEVQELEKSLREQQGKIEQEGRKLSAYQPGQPEYKRIEETTTKQIAGLKVQMQLKRKEIMEREAQIYLDSYREVADVVAAFSKTRNIDLVLRYDREKDTPSADPRETLKVINRPVIYQANLDISQIIVDALGKTSVARRPAPSR